MGCGCKKKKLPASQPRTANVVIVEGEVRSVPERTPEVLTPPPPTEKNVEEIVNKLNSILKP